MLLFSLSVAAMWIAGMALGRRCQTVSHALTFPILFMLFRSRYCLHFSYMAITLPPATAENASGKMQRNGAGTSTGQGLAPSAHLSPDEAHPVFSAAVRRLPVELDVSIPVRNFRGRNLLTLEPSHLVEFACRRGEDVPLAAGRVPLAWSEFESITLDRALEEEPLATLSADGGERMLAAQATPVVRRLANSVKQLIGGTSLAALPVLLCSSPGHYYG